MAARTCGLGLLKDTWPPCADRRLCPKASVRLASSHLRGAVVGGRVQRHTPPRALCSGGRRATNLHASQHPRPYTNGNTKKGYATWLSLWWWCVCSVVCVCLCLCEACDSEFDMKISPSCDETNLEGPQNCLIIFQNFHRELCDLITILRLHQRIGGLITTTGIFITIFRGSTKNMHLTSKIYHFCFFFGFL